MKASGRRNKNGSSLIRPLSLRSQQNLAANILIAGFPEGGTTEGNLTFSTIHLKTIIPAHHTSVFVHLLTPIQLVNFI